MVDLLLFILITSALCGKIGYLYARRTGRNHLRWAAIGIVLNIFALALICRPRYHPATPRTVRPL
jgi:uncharacterized membrane protein YfcA